MAAKKKTEKASLPHVSLEELLEAGAHLGHRAERWHPKISPYLFGLREGVHIFDLEKTREMLLAAASELRRRAALGETFLLVGAKPQAQEAVASVAPKLGVPFITKRWIGGLFTNFEQVKKSIEKMARMKREREAGEYRHFTKKEQLLLDREITRLERLFGGVARLEKLPDLVIVVDINRERTAVDEAQKTGIPIMAIVDSNADPTLVDYPIPANDDSIKSVEYIVGKLGEAIESGLKSRKSQIPNPKSETISNDQIPKQISV